MARSIRLAVACALVAACGRGERLEPPPPGLAYSCGGEPLTIVYGDGGYVPGGSARPVRAGDAPFVARSRAWLTFAGARHELVADDALEDLRYVEVGGDTRLAWVARGETAQLSRVDGEGSEVSLAECSRVRSIGQVTAPPAAAAEPRRP